jgi:hypothetical protein
VFTSLLAKDVWKVVKLVGIGSQTLKEWLISMTNWNWTPLARTIGLLIEAALILGIGWVLFVGTWFALGGS